MRHGGQPRGFIFFNRLEEESEDADSRGLVRYPSRRRGIPCCPSRNAASWITAVIHEKVRYFRYHVVFQRIWRSVRSDRPLRNVGRLISGVERTFSRPSWRAGGGIRARLGSRRRSSGPLGRRRSGRRDRGALRRRPEPHQ